VVGDEQQHPAPALRLVVHEINQQLAQVGPAEVEHAAQVAKGRDDACGQLGGQREVDAPVHAHQGGDGAGVLRPVALALQPSLGAAKGLAVALRQVEQPVDALVDRALVDRLRWGRA